MNIFFIYFIYKEINIATIKDVAKKAGVSTATVSHVINKTRYVSEEVVEKVNNVISELDYRPNSIARYLRCKETKTIGVIISTNLNPYFAEVVQGIEDMGFNAGYSIIVCYTNGYTDNEVTYINQLIEREVDGIIIDSIIEDDILLEVMNKIKIPIILLDRYLDNLKVDFFHVNDHKGGYIGTKYLLELGHRKIGCVTGDCINSNSHSFHQRINGYKKALREYNIAINNNYIISKPFKIKEGYKSFEELMMLNEHPTAIFYFSDIVAIGAISAADKMKIIIPDDVSILGYDNIEISGYTIPGLTSINQEKYEMGQKTVKRLIERIKDKKIKTERFISEPEIIIRGSCARLK